MSEKITIKLANESLSVASDALAALIGPGNRFETTVMLRIDRNLRAIGRAQESVEALRQKLLKENGARMPDDGAREYIFPNHEARGLFQLQWREVMEAESEIAVEPISEAETLAGFFRHPALLPSGKPNPDAGKRESLDIDGGHLVNLRTFGIMPEPAAVLAIVDPEAPPEDAGS